MSPGFWAARWPIPEARGLLRRPRGAALGELQAGRPFPALDPAPPDSIIPDPALFKRPQAALSSLSPTGFAFGRSAPALPPTRLPKAAFCPTS